MSSAIPCFTPEAVGEYSVITLYAGVSILRVVGSVTPPTDKTVVQSLCRALVISQRLARYDLYCILQKQTVFPLVHCSCRHAGGNGW